jgi:hypothetical protein
LKTRCLEKGYHEATLLNQLEFYNFIWLFIYLQSDGIS